jgi:hypothetical protein
MTMAQKHAFGKNGEAGSGVEFANLVPLNRQVADDFAAEDNLVADCPDEGSAEVVPIGKSDGVKSGRGRVASRRGTLGMNSRGGVHGSLGREAREGEKGKEDEQNKGDKRTEYGHVQQELQQNLSKITREKGLSAMVQEVEDVSGPQPVSEEIPERK